MRIKFLLRILLISICATNLTSCDKDDNDDNLGDPVGTISLNMLNEDNGKTELANSDVYITNGNNFYSSSCMLSSLGKRSGLGNISEMLLLGGTNTAAVEPGYAYQVFPRKAVREFPSGKLAIDISSNYYNLYVVSQILQDNTIVGANVKLVLIDVPDNDLPAYNHNTSIKDHYQGAEISIDLPTSDFEYEVIDSYIYNKVVYEKKDNKLIFRLVEYEGFSAGYGVYIRIDNVYTRINFVV